MSHLKNINLNTHYIFSCLSFTWKAERGRKRWRGSRWKSSRWLSWEDKQVLAPPPLHPGWGSGWWLWTLELRVLNIEVPSLDIMFGLVQLSHLSSYFVFSPDNIIVAVVVTLKTLPNILFFNNLSKYDK